MLKQNNHSQLSLKYGLLAGLVSTSLFLSGCIPNQVIQPTAQSKPVTQSKKANVKVTTEINPQAILNETSGATHYPIVWDEMRQHFDLAHAHFGKYDAYLRFYNKRKTHLKKVSERSKPYLHYIFNEVKKRGMPYEMALLPIVESGFRPHARSSQRAVGLWQFIPGTAEMYGMDRNWWYDGRKDVIKSTKSALDYLEKLYKNNNNDWLLALASYNAGLGNVYKAQRIYRKKHKDQPGIKEYQPNYWEITPYLPKETQSYVPKLLAVSHLIEYSELFELEITPVENEPFFSVVKLDKQVSLNQVASLSETPEQLLASLNPGYHQPATPPNGPHYVLLPINKVDDFNAKISRDHSIFDIQWQKHKIRSGDSLSVIAEKYQTSSRAIKKLNRMKNSRIRAGKTLLIPIPANKSGLVTQTVKTEKQRNTHSTSKRYANKAKHIHTVKPGDSLWKLARYYNITTKKLTDWNNISAKKSLRVGQKLTIYSNQYGQKIQHTLKTGESLWHLAKRYNVSSKDIAGWNNISLKKVLQPGMKLTIWTQSPGLVKAKTQKTLSYTVKRGDNLWDIAKANNVSAKQLASFNKLSIKSLLQPGQVIRIPLQSKTTSKQA